MPITDETNPYATSEPVENLDPGSVSALPAPQRVRFTLSTEGNVAYNVYRSLRNSTENRLRRRSQVILIVIAVVMALMGGVLLFTNWRDGRGMVFPMVLLFFSSWFVFRALRLGNPQAIGSRLQRYMDMANGGESNLTDSGEVEFTIDHDGVTIRDKHETSHCIWQGFKQVVVEPHYLFLIRSPLMAYSIPRSAFPNERAYLGFANLAQQLHQEHGPKSADQ